MKVTCKVCNTSKNIKEVKLEPYRGKTISTKCANKECTHRIKFKVPLIKEENKKTESIKTKPTKKKEHKQPKETHHKPSKPITKDKKQLSCPNCKAEITADTNFCVECGQKIVKQPIPTKAEVIKCVNCGRIYEKGEKFCLECGTPKELKTAESKPLPKIPNPKIVEKTSTKKENVVLKPTQQPIKKQKNKSGCWSVLWKVVLAIIIIISIAVVAFFVLESSEEYELTDGPWEVTASLSEELYGDNVNNRTLEEAIVIADANYALTLNASSIDVAISGNYEGSEEVLSFDQYSPYKNNSFYLFTIIVEDANNGEIRIILHLKSDEYFEGKAFFISNNEVSIADIKGSLIK